DILAYLRALANPADEVSLLRIINTPPRGIGAGSIELLLRVAVTEGLPLWSVLPRAVSAGELAHGVGDRVEAFRRLIESYRGRLGTTPLHELARELIEVVDYRSELARAYPEPAQAAARWASVEELVNSIALYERRSEQPSL